MEGRHRLQDPSAATPAAALAAPDDPLHRPARRLSRPQIRWRAGNPDPVARPPANGRHHRRLSQLPHRLRHAAMTRPTARTPPRDPNNRQQTAYSSLSDADLWGKIRTWSGHPRLWRGDPGRLETWMPGTSPGKGFSEAKFAAKRSARTTVQFSPDGPASGAREEKAGKTARPAPAGRGRGPWRIGDAPPDRRTHACAERGGRVRGSPSAAYACARGGDSRGVTAISSFCDRRSTVIGTSLPTRSSVINRCSSSISP